MDVSCISWHIILMLPYKYDISNKVKEALYKITHRGYPENPTVSIFIAFVINVGLPFVIYMLKILNIYFSFALFLFYFGLTLKYT